MIEHTAVRALLYDGSLVDGIVDSTRTHLAYYGWHQHKRIPVTTTEFIIQES